jgi:hypothetical protein
VSKRNYPHVFTPRNAAPGTCLCGLSKGNTVHTVPRTKPAPRKSRGDSVVSVPVDATHPYVSAGRGYPPGECKRCDRPRGDRIHKDATRATYAGVTVALAPVVPESDVRPTPGLRTAEQLRHVPIAQWSHPEVEAYVAYVLESWAHLNGDLGSLRVPHLLALADRLRTKVVWSQASVRHRPGRYTVRPTSPETTAGARTAGFEAFIGPDLIGWAPTVSDARDLCEEWEDKG